MALIDPKKRQAEREAEGKSSKPELGEGTKRIDRECRIPGAVVGWEHFESSRKGTPGIMVRFVALSGPDVGKVTERNFWLTDAATAQFADFLLALGHEEPLDPYNNEHLEVAFAHGAVMMDIKGEEYQDKNGNPKMSYRPAWFGEFTGKGEKSWNKVLEGAEEGWNNYVGWRANNPRKAAGSGGDATNYGGGGGSTGGGPDEDIPFLRCASLEHPFADCSFTTTDHTWRV